MHVIETLGSGGAERLLHTYLKNLDRSTIRSFVVTVRDQGTHWRQPIEALGVEVFSLGCRSRRDFPRAVGSLGTLLRRLRATLVHTHLWEANVIGRVAGRLTGVPVVSSIHSPDYEPEVWQTGYRGHPAKRHVFREIDRVTAHLSCRRIIAVSEYVRRSTHNRLGFPLDRIDVIYNPIDVEELNQSSGPSRSELLSTLRLPHDSLILLNVGRLSPEKGLHYALQAMPGVLRRQPNVHLVSAGAMDYADWVSRLRQDVEALGLSGHVHFLGERRDIPVLLRAADLFVFPSLFEGLGLALAEAMAAGCACIASDIAAIPEIVKNDVDGWLVPVGDSNALEARILSALGNPERREKVGRAAAESARIRFNPSAAAAKIAATYELALQRTG